MFLFKLALIARSKITLSSWFTALFMVSEGFSYDTSESALESPPIWNLGNCATKMLTENNRYVRWIYFIRKIL